MRSTADDNRARARGLTLIEVIVSVAVVAIVVMGSLMVRYYAVRHSVRADAYNTASRIGQLFLEGWRSTEFNVYEPYSRIYPHLPTVEQWGDGPDVTGDMDDVYTSPAGVEHYRVTLDGIQFYATLGYLAPVTTVGSERPAVIHVAVGFMENYGDWSNSGAQAVVRITSIK